jgi:hypothetical protein
MQICYCETGRLRRKIEQIKYQKIVLEKHPSVGSSNLIFSFIPTQRLNTSTTQHLYNKYFHTLLVPGFLPGVDIYLSGIDHFQIE